ncbi:RNA exonuclease 1-like [Hondaea fermentalgiana]|uniref:RNA exonuclease 1-like n=1 Tax=Hondaea fermentalgiana TaxID=2315210 RepID=A0A2R5GDJ4_9STRA|nr:RNA exonuclease 1-like [Hondaea fermentalgiana]|eukprot:GBG26713.1 RNA exonuclease 1-like [Hondaea fermentalgiana]
MSEKEIKELQRKFTGVVFHKQEKKWRARYYRNDGKRSWLKSLYPTAEKAARAYDAAVLEDGLPAQPLNFVSPEDRLAAEKKRAAAALRTASATPQGGFGSLSDLVRSASTLTAPKPQQQPGQQPQQQHKQQQQHQSRTPLRSQMSNANPATVTGAKRKRPIEEPAAAPEPTQSGQVVAAEGLANKRRAKKKQRRERQRDNKRQQDDPAAASAKAKADLALESQHAAKAAAEAAVANKPLIQTLRARPVRLAEHAPPKSVDRKMFKTTEGMDEAATWSTRRPQARPKLDASKIDNEPMRDVVDLVELTSTEPSWARYYDPLLERFDKENWIETKATTKTRTQGDEDMDDDDDDKGAKPPRLFGLDCEMVLCKPATQVDDANVQPASVLARVSLVECTPTRDGAFGTKAEFKILFDEYVKIPDTLQVVDLLTHVSGIEQKHLDEAKLSFEEAQNLVTDHVRSTDIVVGHSLWSDYGALCLWHGNTVDTTALCGVRNLPHMTLSLKDAAVAVLHDQRELEQFQESGEAHDSVADAEWSIRVMFKLLELSKSRKVALPYLFKKIPDRYRARLTFHLLPVSADEDGVRALVSERLPEDVKADETTMEVRQIRWSERRDGSKVGSVVVDMASPELAHKVFEALPCVQTGCGGFDNSPPSCAAGWPDRQGMPRKLVRAPSAPEEFLTCEVISYFPMNLQYTRTMRIRTSVLGRLMGPSGRIVLMIQQVCGARIVITRQPDKNCEDPRYRTAAQIQVAADAQSKLEQAIQMVHSALKNELTVQKKPQAY